MRKKKLFGVVVLILLLLLASCGNNNDGPEEPETNGSTQTEVDTESDSAEATENESQQKDEEIISGEDNDDNNVDIEDTVPIKVYFSNDDATAFTSEEVSIPSLSPEEVLGALISKGAVVADVKVLSFETLQLEGKETIELDLNEAFSTYVSSMGTTGEYYVIGSICNTFLDAYDCEQIRITVEGKVLETGHAEYPGYMTIFE